MTLNKLLAWDWSTIMLCECWHAGEFLSFSSWRQNGFLQYIGAHTRCFRPRFDIAPTQNTITRKQTESIPNTTVNTNWGCNSKTRDMLNLMKLYVNREGNNKFLEVAKERPFEVSKPKKFQPELRTLHLKWKCSIFPDPEGSTESYMKHAYQSFLFVKQKFQTWLRRKYLPYTSWTRSCALRCWAHSVLERGDQHVCICWWLSEVLLKYCVYCRGE